MKNLRLLVVSVFILLTLTFFFIVPHNVHANSEIIKLDKNESVFADQNEISLLLTDNYERYESSIIKFSNKFTIINPESLPESIQIDTESQLITINWDTLKTSEPLKITFQLPGESETLLEIETLNDDSQKIKEKILIEEPIDQLENYSSVQLNDSASEISHSKSHESFKNDTNLSVVEQKALESQEDAVSESNTNSISDLSNHSSYQSSEVNNPITQYSSSKDEAANKLLAKNDSKILKRSTVSTQLPQVSGNTVNVSTWDDFVKAMANEDVGTINITNNFSAYYKAFDDEDELVNGNKLINGQQHIINFSDYGFDIQNYQVTIANTVVETNQDKTDNNASLFFSSIGGELNIENVSYNDVQVGQVAQLPLGKVTISGANIFVTEGPFEIFEANHVVFSESSSFIAGNLAQKLITNNLKEIINLHGNSTIDVEANAKVTLQISDRLSVINSINAQSSQINIKEKASLNIIAENVDTNDGQPVINLLGPNSSINLGKNATLNIENNRLSTNKPGALIAMNGSLNLHDKGNQVEYWRMGSNNQQYSGQNYVKFPQIYTGAIQLSGTTMTNALADPQSSTAISDNSSLNNKQFSTLLSNNPTTNLNRLYISDVQAPAQPKLKQITDLSTSLSGTALPNQIIDITNEFGHTWQTKANGETGAFSVDLGAYAPYDAGETFTITSSDSFGNISEPLTISVVGVRLSFKVPSKMAFQQTVIRDELITIPRVDADWGIEVTNTRQNANPWRLTAHAPNPLTTHDGSSSINNALTFTDNSGTYSLLEEALIYQQQATDTTRTNIHWAGDQGILLQLNPKQADVKTYTSYSTTINWTLTNAP